MSRRARWAPRLLPEARRDTVAQSLAESERLLTLRPRAEAAGRPDLAADLERHAAAGRELAAQLRGSDLYWVTGPMARIALDASLDVPAWDASPAPSRMGLMVFADALPPWDATAAGGLTLRGPGGEAVPHEAPVPVSAAAWDVSGAGHVRVWLLARPEALPLRVAVHQGKHLVPLAGMLAPRHADLETLVAVGQGGVDEASVGVVSLLMSCWTLMMMPTVAERRTLDSRTGGQGAPRTPVHLGVDVIDLRPLRHVDVDRDAVTGRRLTVRHLVRGHWTHQAYGRDRALRRLQWVAPYIKGPSGAPLKTSEDRVMVWRRA